MFIFLIVRIFRILGFKEYFIFRGGIINVFEGWIDRMNARLSAWFFFCKSCFVLGGIEGFSVVGRVVFFFRGSVVFLER